jgi:hypothetical protein|tara:strand:+ start:609 stop:899 length:291 start_codon:yes stop_codon:yes gene_type:complete
MAGSDIQANTVTTQGSNVSAFGGPTRLKGFIITPSTTAGTVTFVDDATSKFTVTTGASVDSGPINISLPDEGVKFGTDLKVNISANGASGVTVFFA